MSRPEFIYSPSRIIIRQSSRPPTGRHDVSSAVIATTFRCLRGTSDIRQVRIHLNRETLHLTSSVCNEGSATICVNIQHHLGGLREIYTGDETAATVLATGPISSKKAQGTLPCQLQRDKMLAEYDFGTTYSFVVTGEGHTIHTVESFWRFSDISKLKRPVWLASI